MNDLVTFLKDLTPLLQTLLWVMVLVWFFFCGGNWGFFFTPSPAGYRRGGHRNRADKIGRTGKTTFRCPVTEGDEIGKKVTQLFLVTMSPAMFANLEKIASGHFGSFQKSRGLERELYHLRDIGYIEVPSVRGLPREGPDLS